MNGRRGRLAGEDLAAVLRQVYGTNRALRDVARLTGGTKKGVYRLTQLTEEFASPAGAVTCRPSARRRRRAAHPAPPRRV